ncbi:transketolase family protein [Nocardia alba]|uniref:transketolase n=1 Tax=Nocardia alba TaxID=225051 RepID=A0A4R1FZ67_9NOCA|nr:transketolase [Nocardia alba]TCJ99132.1 transketolase [Nocardia alba]
MTDIAPTAFLPSLETDLLAVDTLRFLAADMVEAAQSGHPGMPMGAAPMAWTLWSRHLRHDPADPEWADRDRFVLSAGHGSALLYGLLHLFGYDLPIEELRRFRQLGSRTPGHPEFGVTPGVECTTGPLGQGLAMAVGMALAERMTAARYPEITGHRTYAIVGDGCLMEGVSHEVASFAGHLGLGGLIVLWDDNEITIDGAVGRSCGDDQVARFAAYGWHTDVVADGTDIEAIDAALTRAGSDPRPSFLAVRTVIGHGAPGVAGTSKVHGSPLGAERLAQAKQRAGWSLPPFAVPAEVAATCAVLAAIGGAEHAKWRNGFEAFGAAEPKRAAEFGRAGARLLPAGALAALGAVAAASPRATRQSSQACLDALRSAMPELVGGSADLAGSTGTVGGEVVRRDDFTTSAIAFGIREFGMAAILNGMSLHGGFRVFGATFLVFADYLRPALRLSALMGQPVIYVLTHDSVAVGEDGPTHQPVEQVESLRMIPGVRVLRPADDAETALAWQLALTRVDGPTALILSRQSLPQLDMACDGDGARIAGSDAATHHHSPAARALGAPAARALGAPVGARESRAGGTRRIDIVATGSEVALAVAVRNQLWADGYDVRVVSALDRARFTPDPSAHTISIEAGSTAGWAGSVDLAIGIDEFGHSGPGDEVLAHFGFTEAAVRERIRAYLDGAP